MTPTDGCYFPLVSSRLLLPPALRVIISRTTGGEVLLGFGQIDVSAKEVSYGKYRKEQHQQRMHLCLIVMHRVNYTRPAHHQLIVGSATNRSSLRHITHPRRWRRDHTPGRRALAEIRPLSYSSSTAAPDRLARLSVGIYPTLRSPLFNFRSVGPAERPDTEWESASMYSSKH